MLPYKEPFLRSVTSQTRDKILCELLSIDAPSPEILLEEDGDLCLDWRTLSVSISVAGDVNWAFLDGDRSDPMTQGEYGYDLERVKQIIGTLTHD